MLFVIAILISKSVSSYRKSEKSGVNDMLKLTVLHIFHEFIASLFPYFSETLCTRHVCTLRYRVGLLANILSHCVTNIYCFFFIFGRCLIQNPVGKLVIITKVFRGSLQFFWADCWVEPQIRSGLQHLQYLIY
jgi:hypothetical protein